MIEVFREGGPVMWPLLLLSVVSVALIIERALHYAQRLLRRSPGETDQILRMVEEGNLTQAEKLASQRKSDYVIRTLSAGLTHKHSMTQALETQAMTEIRHMRRNLSSLNTIITAAPLLGILGTVLGIIYSFEVLGSQGVGDPLAVTQGISQALITTAFGLIISLVTLIPYNLFQSFVRDATQELEKYASTLEMITQKNSLAADSVKRMTS